MINKWRHFISSWLSLDVFIVAVAWQSAIKLRWHVLLLITANDTRPLWVTNVPITYRVCSPLPLPSPLPLMFSLSHLLYTICAATNTPERIPLPTCSISPIHLQCASISANISQYLLCQLVNSLVVCLKRIWVQGYGHFVEMKVTVYNSLSSGRTSSNSNFFF